MFEVGQKLWFVRQEARTGAPTEVTVSKIGRKWAYFYDGRYRCDSSGEVDGGEYQSPGKCYLSKSVYEDEKAIMAAWRNLRARLDAEYMPPKWMTVAEIENIKVMLFQPRAKQPGETLKGE